MILHSYFIPLSVKTLFPHNLVREEASPLPTSQRIQGSINADNLSSELASSQIEAASDIVSELFLRQYFQDRDISRVIHVGGKGPRSSE